MMETSRMMENQPLILSMENVSGEEVTLSIEPMDDFQTFLEKARNLLGFEVDINSVTRNQPVSLSDNIYQYLLNSENGFTTDLELTTQSLEQMMEPTDDSKDLVYILDDGTQINASQIHFDNEDDPVDLTAEKIPFVKHLEDDIDYTEENVGEENTRKYNIVDSPVSKWSTQNTDFVNSLPFKLVCNNTSGFEAQFTKYLEGRNKTYTTLNPVTVKNKSPRSLIRDNYKAYDVNKYDNNSAFSREDVLNMFKDSPVASIPSDNFIEKRRHVRKTDPSRPVFKKNEKNQPISYIDVDGTLIGQNENQNCFICTKFVENNLEKLYLFDNEDQKIHRESVLKKQVTQLKIICEKCLNLYFKPCTSRSPNQSLKSDEYLVIRNNQQYIFQKTNAIDFKTNLPSGNFVKFGEATAIIDKIESEILKGSQDKEFLKVEIGSDGQIINTIIDNVAVDIVKNEKGSSSDVEIIEPTEQEIDDNVIDNLEDAEEHVKEFLGKYQTVPRDAELKCRFCEKLFTELSQVIDHGSEHKHDLEDGEVYPCPLCDYGYANFKWLKGHLKAAHENSKKTNTDEVDKEKSIESKTDNTEVVRTSPKCSPIATRTRNSNRKKDAENIDKATPEKSEDVKIVSPNPENNIGKNISQHGPIIIKTEVKQETLETSDEEAIWIVQTAEDGEDLNEEQVRNLLQKAKAKNPHPLPKGKKNQCLNCRQLFISEEMLVLHKCMKRRGRKRKSSKDEGLLTMLPGADFLKKARKKKDGEPSSYPQVVTCHNCNESFTSKVRLKFHMQFHEPTNMLLPSGQYNCPECADFIFSTESALFDHVHFQHNKQKRWQCLVPGCGKTFYLRANLTKHSRIHTDTRRYVCPTCGKRFLDKQTLDEHGVTHLQIKPFQCHICMKQLTRRSRLRMHLRAHEEEPALRALPACARCRRAFPDLQRAQEHLKSSTSCLESIAIRVKKETKDLQLSPSSGLVSKPTDEEQEELMNFTNKPIRFQAETEMSNKILSNLPEEAKALIRVVEIEKAFRCEYCEDVFYLEEGLNEHRQIHKGVKNPFTCHICKVSFATYSRCTTHKTTHGYYKRPVDAAGRSHPGILGYGGFPVAKHFLCEDCGRSYLHWTYLQVHRRMKHANDNYVYDCTACNIIFPNSWSLAYHKKKNHSKDGDEDPITNKKVGRDDYRIPCRDCDEVLPNKAALYKHRKNKHSDNSLNKQGGFWCLWCSAHYSSRLGLEAHAQIHLKDVEASGQSSEGGRKLCTHTTNTAFPCDACAPSFNRSQHVPGSCPRCGKRFRQVAALRAHCRMLHPHNVTVVEIASSNPSPDEVMTALTNNNIDTDNIIDISKIFFAKGTSSIKPCSERTLSLLSGLQRSDVTWTTAEQPSRNVDLLQPLRRSRMVTKNPRLPAILQRGGNTETMNYTHINIEGDEQTDINMQLLLRNEDGSMVEGRHTNNDGSLSANNSMLQLKLNDNILMHNDGQY